MFSGVQKGRAGAVFVAPARPDRRIRHDQNHLRAGPGATPHINQWFQRGQLVSALTLGMVHGSNDAQKTMGLITLGLAATGSLDTFHVPGWVIV